MILGKGEIPMQGIVGQLAQDEQRRRRWITLAGLSCGAGFLTALWVGLLLAEAGRFSAWVALLTAVVAGGFAWRHFRRRRSDRSAPEMNQQGLLAAAALALLSFAFTVPPSEFILGGWDPGVYVHTAAVLAHDGSLRPKFSDLAALDADSRSVIGRQGHDAWQPFTGMRMMPDGHLSPQFYHLYPVLMALLWPFGGVRAALMANPLLNAICIVALYLWACRWVKPRWAFAAALALALNPAQVWQAGFSTAELLAQSLLLVGLLATDRALSGQTNDRSDAIMAGAAFGLMMLARYDAMLFVVPFLLVLLTGLRDKSQRGQLVILVCTTVGLGVQLWLHQRYLAPLYYPMENLVVPGLWAAGILALLISMGAVLIPPRTADNAQVAPDRRTGLRVAAVVGFVAWVFLYWYVRPHLTVDGRVLGFFTWLYPHLKEADWFPLVAGRDARNFWYLQSLFGTFGLVAALSGIAIMIVRTRTTWRTAWLVASLGVLAILMTQIYHEPFMMFVSRRLVSVIIPLLCLGVAALCDRLEWVWRAPRRGILVGWLVLGLTLMDTFGGTLFIAGHREWPGLVNWQNQLADRIPRGALVYSDQPGFAAPLRFIYGIQAYDARAISSHHRTAPMTMMMKKAEQHAVFWLTASNVPEAYAAYATPMTTIPLRSVILGTTRHTVPRYVRERSATFTLYRITPMQTSLTRPAGPAG